MTDNTPALPATEAGRALLADDEMHEHDCPVWLSRLGAECICGLDDRVLAIEAEARASGKVRSGSTSGTPEYPKVYDTAPQPDNTPALPVTEHPEAVCNRCERPNPTWFAPSPIWNEVMRGDDRQEDLHGWGIICPPCFAELAEARDIGTKGAWLWQPEAEARAAQPATLTVEPAKAAQARDGKLLSALIDMTAAYHQERLNKGHGTHDWRDCQKPRCQNVRLLLDGRGPWAIEGAEPAPVAAQARDGLTVEMLAEALHEVGWFDTKTVDEAMEPARAIIAALPAQPAEAAQARDGELLAALRRWMPPDERAAGDFMRRTGRDITLTEYDADRALIESKP